MGQEKLPPEVLRMLQSSGAKQLVDMVNKPPHYHQNEIDVHYFLEHFFPKNGTFTVYEGFCMGQVIKYTVRHKEKGGLESLDKAEYYIKELKRLWMEAEQSESSRVESQMAVRGNNSIHE